jgi:MFS family permease
MLGLIVVISTVVCAMPFACLPSLFQEMSEDLGLSLVQIGSVWGMVSLAGVFFSIIAGLLGDRFGVKRIITISCLLAGIFGAARGMSGSFLAISATVFIHGIVRVMLPINITKTIGIWFRGKYLGLANGIGAMGMGLGLMLGPMLSATVMSPAFGGWRNVLYFYGALSVLVAVLWFIFGREPRQVDSTSGEPATIPFRQAFSEVIRIKALWLLGITIMLRMGAIQGMTGYLPLYLRGQEWAEAAADGALSTFYATSTICVIPLSSLSDRLGSRKVILFPAILISIISFGMLPFVDSVVVWILMILSGSLMDAFMAISSTMMLEMEGVRPEFFGTAVGLVFTIAQLGGVISPPLGNSLASVSPGLPFIFWAGLSLASLFTLAFIKETGWRSKKAVGG